MVTNLVFFRRTTVKQNNNQTHFFFSLICNTNFNNLKSHFSELVRLLQQKKLHKVETAKHILMS